MSKIEEKNIKARYINYDSRVKEYMDLLIGNLVSEYGSINPEWVLVLDMIAQNFEVYYIGYDDIKNNGIYTFDKHGNKQRNPAISLQLNTQAYIQKLIGQMGWTILSKSKLKAPEVYDSSDDAFED